jgi:17beta-estradiol 17-dehydrogenase / very-long-chain 3-oxoacyl-CoA reductase
MGLCCYLSSIEVLIFYIGAFFILRWVWRIVKTGKEIY